MKKQIEVWYDETSDADKPSWCLSLCDYAGEVELLSTHDSIADAISAGRKAAQKQGLHLYAQSQNGSITKIVTDCK